MVVSVCFFVAGTSLYKRNPPEGNVVVDVTKAVCVSILSDVIQLYPNSEFF